jgi:hypothetical protein
VDEGGGCGVLYLPPNHFKSPLPPSRSQILLGPGFAEGLGSHAPPPQPFRMSGGVAGHPAVDQALFRALGTLDLLALFLGSPGRLASQPCQASPGDQEP